MNNLANRNYIHTSPAIVNAKYSLTKSESDLVLMLLAQIDKDDADFKKYKFTKSQLEERVGVEIHSTQLYHTAKSLMSKVLSIKHSNNKWELYSWVSGFKYDNGLIEIGFHPDLLPYLIQLKQYIFADSRQLLEMKSDYSRRIYLLLKEYAKFGSREFTLEELRNILETPKSLKLYSNFKKEIIDKSIKEINKFTDLDVSYQEIKQIRKVIAVRFEMKKNILDFKVFKESIRDLYPNEPLCYYEDRLIQCSDGRIAQSGKSLLYFADTLDFVDMQTAQKMWEYMFEHKKDLICFKM